MGVPDAAGKYGARRQWRRPQRVIIAHKTERAATPPFLFLEDQPLTPLKRRARIQRQRAVEVLVDILRPTIRRGIEVRQNGSELRLRASAEIVQYPRDERAAQLPPA